MQKASGGDGNFVLSSSFLGYTSAWGGVAPMTQDGYGIFYKMDAEKSPPGCFALRSYLRALDDRITVFVSAWRGGDGDLEGFTRALHWAFARLKELLSKIPPTKPHKL